MTDSLERHRDQQELAALREMILHNQAGFVRMRETGDAKNAMHFHRQIEKDRRRVNVICERLRPVTVPYIHEAPYSGRMSS